MKIDKKKEILLGFQSTIPAWIAQNPEPLINKAVFRWTPSISYFRKELGLRCKSNITTMDIDVVLQACSCGWNPAGQVNIDMVPIDVTCIEVEDALCDKDLICKYTQWYVDRFTAGRESFKASFEETLISGIVAKVMLANENLIWKGDTSSGTPNLALYDGLIKQLTAASAPTITTSGSMINQLIAVNASIPIDAFNFGTPIIFVGIDMLRSVQAEIPSLNWYNPINGTNLDPTNPAPSFILPGTNTRVVGVIGLNGTGLAIGTFEGNFIYGTDFREDEETVDFWYSRDNQEYRYVIKYFSGTAAIFPEYTVVATLDAVDLSTLGQYGVTILNTTANPVPTQTVP